jgi:phosphate:Na+ symporter
MNYGIFEILTLFGALCLFLLGMKSMSQGIQKLAGEKMRDLLGAMTTNRFAGVFTGLLITGIIQSSSATTVMVVSFVNAGLLNLAQSIGVIMGANIGTTLTAWIVSLLGFKVDLADIVIPLFGIGAPLLLMRKEKFQFIGEFIIGFALLFLGLEFMQDSVPDLQSNPELFQWLSNLTDLGGWSIIIFIGIGTLVTIVLQSSSASMALTMVMCANGWIGFEHGAAISLGENIGTTLTANLAALMGNVHAKRAALAHAVFNILGGLLVLLVFNFYLTWIERFMLMAGLDSPFTNPETIPIALAAFHTSSNILQTVVFIGFIKYFAIIVEFLLPSKGKKSEQSHLEYFDSGFLQAAELSVLQAKKEINRLAGLSHRMFNFIPEMVTENKKEKFEEIRKRVVKYEKITDMVEEEITTFLIKVSNQNLSDQSSEELRRLRVVCAEIEKIGDVCFKMASLLAKKKEEKVYFLPAQREKFTEMVTITNEAFEHMLVILEKGEAFARQNLQKAIGIEKRINAFRDSIGELVIEDYEKGEGNIKSVFYFYKLITSCEKIGDNIINISEAIAGVNLE